MSDVTRDPIQRAVNGPAATGQFLSTMYDELRELAAMKLTHEKAGQTSSDGSSA